MKLTKTLFAASAAALALFSASPALADGHSEAPAVEAASTGPALWKVADEDTTIYLFGTVHALPADVNWYSGAVKTALDSSDTLVTEVDMNDEALAAIQQLMGAKGVYRDGSTLRSRMTEEQKTVFEQGMAKLGLAPNAFDALEPWLASQNMVQVAMMKAGIDFNNGTEVVLERTIGEDVGRGSLETAEFQIGIFDGLPEETQMAQLIEAAQDVESIGPFLSGIIDAWEVGNIEAVAKQLNEAMKDDPKFAEALFYSRNRNWADWIDTRLETPGTVFMAVGAGHLAGVKSVQEYLTKLGITTARVQ